MLCVFVVSTGTAAPAAAQSFTATGSLHIARTEHAAVLLADGRVLASGGMRPNSSVFMRSHVTESSG